MLSTQAWLLAICNFVIFVSVVISVFLIKDDGEQGKKGTALFKTVIALLSFLFVMALQVYSLNCMVFGNCLLWSWIVSVFAAIGCIAYICVFVYVVVLKKTSIKQSVPSPSPIAYAPPMPSPIAAPLQTVPVVSPVPALGTPGTQQQ